MDQIDALRLFTRLVERGSFSAAAKDMRIKQSTASKWVAELEARLGTTLVQRTTRSIQVTESGQRLLAGAKNVLSAFDELSAELEEQSPEPIGRVRVSVPVVLGRRFIVPSLAVFLKAHPRVEAEIVLGDRYVNLVEEGFDLAVRVGVPTDTSARGRKLADGRRLLVASPAYVKANGKPKEPRDLRAHECLVHGEANASVIWRFARDQGSEVPVPVRGRIVGNNSEVVLEMARAGLGIALLADWLVGEEVRKGRLVVLLEGYGCPRAPIYVLTPPGRFLSTTVRALVTHLASTLVTLGAG